MRGFAGREFLMLAENGDSSSVDANTLNLVVARVDLTFWEYLKDGMDWEGNIDKFKLMYEDDGKWLDLKICVGEGYLTGEEAAIAVEKDAPEPPEDNKSAFEDDHCASGNLD
ncbi:hypothetical protein K402DRAFT_169428 [Aulographum hederae CBS 113979]|uniref:Uncharacterized protein n=1 Tax=Aulographum hederae CBS 113979 TaxID=1176131 RepID=A0A6G1HDC2_9PEZI|nr:hypothetical protein K402DRAFT_169428 [Aulographum hederae CBS 113979]